MPAKKISIKKLSELKELYERTYLDIEKKWIKLGPDGKLRYRLHKLIPLAAGPLYALNCSEHAFSMRRPFYSLEDGHVYDFGLLYYRSVKQPTIAIWVNSRSYNLINDYHREVSLGSSYVFLYEVVNSFVNECRVLPNLPKKLQRYFGEFSEARMEGIKQGIPIVQSTRQTVIAQTIQRNIDSLIDLDYTPLRWSYFHSSSPIPLALAFCVTHELDKVAHASVVCTVGMSKLDFLTTLKLVRPLTVKDRALIARTEKGLNHAERRRI